MFRVPQLGDPKGHLSDEHYEYASTYLARMRRILFLRGPMISSPPRSDGNSPSSISDDIMAMNVEDPTRPIYLVIDSPGGFVDSGLALYDVIKFSRAPVVTIGVTAASMATVILVAGVERLVFPSTRVMMHLPLGGIEGDVDTIKIRSEEMQRVKDALLDRYIECGVNAGLPDKSPAVIRKRVLKDIDREHWLGAEGAIKYGLVDRIVTPDDLFGLNPPGGVVIDGKNR